MIRRFLWFAAWFLTGAVFSATPFVVRGHLLHVAETARGEQTMGPGILTFVGLLVAPAGGVCLLLIAMMVRKLKRKRQAIEHGLSSTDDQTR